MNLGMTEIYRDSRQLQNTLESQIKEIEDFALNTIKPMLLRNGFDVAEVRDVYPLFVNISRIFKDYTQIEKYEEIVLPQLNKIGFLGDLGEAGRKFIAYYNSLIEYKHSIDTWFDNFKNKSKTFESKRLQESIGRKLRKLNEYSYSDWNGAGYVNSVDGTAFDQADYGDERVSKEDMKIDNTPRLRELVSKLKNNFNNKPFLDRLYDEIETYFEYHFDLNKSERKLYNLMMDVVGFRKYNFPKVMGIESKQRTEIVNTLEILFL